MANTAAVSARFWAAMGERYGKRWLAEYGDQPTPAWRELLDRFTPYEITDALALLVKRTGTQTHPPTLPQFEALLIDASRHRKAERSADDQRRGYWRSRVINAVARRMGYTGPIEFEPVMVAHKATLGDAMARALEACDSLETTTGQRSDGIENHCDALSAAIASNYLGLHKREEQTPEGTAPF